MIDYRAEYHILAHIGPQAERFGNEHAPEPVNGEAGEPVRLAENKAARGKIIAHDVPAVVDGVLHAAAEEGFVKAVVRVVGNDAHRYLAVVVQKTGAQIIALRALDVHYAAVLEFALPVRDLLAVNPRMTVFKRSFRLFGDGEYGVLSHSDAPFECLSFMIAQISSKGNTADPQEKAGSAPPYPFT